MICIFNFLEPLFIFFNENNGGEWFTLTLYTSLASPFLFFHVFIKVVIIIKLSLPMKDFNKSYRYIAISLLPLERN